MNNDKRNDRPESYPKPTETDTMLKQQDEFNESLDTESSSHYPQRDSEPPQVKETSRNETDTPDQTRDLP